jgi:hypothetical protein
MPKKIEIQPIENGFTLNIDYGNANNSKVFVSSLEELKAGLDEIFGAVTEEDMAEEALEAKRQLLMQGLSQAEAQPEAMPQGRSSRLIKII